MLLQTVLLLLSITTSAVGLAAVLVRTGRQFGTLQADLAAHRRETAARFESADVLAVERFAAVDARFESAEALAVERFAAVDARLEGADAVAVERFAAVDARFDAVDGRLDGLDRRLDGVDRRLDGVDDRLVRVEDGLRDVRVDLARVGGRLSSHLIDPHAHEAAAG